VRIGRRWYYTQAFLFLYIYWLEAYFVHFQKVGVAEAGKYVSEASRLFESTSLDGLLPLRVNADYTADGSGQADEAIIEAHPVEGGRGNGQVADVGDELEAAGGSFSKGWGKGEHVSWCFDSHFWVNRFS
jgi:hypothetical protein